MTTKPRNRETGIRVRHAVTCPAAGDVKARCSCTPRYQARVWSTRDGREKVKVFRAAAAEAKNWRARQRRIQGAESLREARGRRQIRD